MYNQALIGNNNVLFLFQVPIHPQDYLHTPKKRKLNKIKKKEKRKKKYKKKMTT